MRVFVCSTFGFCESNQHYTTRIFDYMISNGHTPAKSAYGSDLIVVVTCGFDDERESKALEVCSFYAKRYGGQRVIVTGCLPDISPKPLKRLGVRLVPIRKKELLDRIFSREQDIRLVKGNRINHGIVQKGFKEDYYIQIAEGCVNYCSYCAIRKAKGHVRSKPVKEIIEEMKTGLKEGHRRFLLLADDCGSYGADIGTDLAVLLNRLQSLHKDARLGIHYIHPSWFLRLSRKISVSAWKSVYFMNIPLQSASERILRIMNRPYAVPEILAEIRRIRKISPSIHIETHIIVGFPGESESETLKCLDLQPFFDSIICFIYSRRSGTPAAKLKGLSDTELKKRIMMVDNWIKRYGNFESGHEKGYLIDRYGLAKS